MSRESRTVSEKLADVQVGDHDVVSRAAYAARIQLCGVQYPKKPGTVCTRAAGHTEADRMPSKKHVAAGLGWIALMVWFS